MNGSIAKRYATALYEEAKAQFVDQQIYEHLGMLHTTMKAEPDLQMALINPRVTAEKKYKLLLLASGLDPEANTLYTRFLRLLLKNHRPSASRRIGIAKWNVSTRSIPTSLAASGSASVTATMIIVTDINLKR